MKYAITGEYTVSSLRRHFTIKNHAWHPDQYLNRFFLITVKAWAQEQLHLKGYLLLNDLYLALGFERTSEGAILGWAARNFDASVDLIIEQDISRSGHWVLDFNVGGVIYDLIS